ncbi:MAG: Rieske 2Fe-2S domain-containing protein, partial [Actinobacteria bacterium]|nr:Rieske 2Fe-2S domain-containing protein [Actinomycetota bacterium]
WVFVGHASRLREPGSCLTAVVGAEPVVVVRGDDDRLRGFLNVCRHRGMPVARESSDGGAPLRCEYHGWEWDLAGDLVRVPQRRTQFPDLDLAELGLLPVSVASWGGFVFVHTNPESSPPFEEWLGDFPSHCGDFPWDDLVEVTRVQAPLACNWKLFVENHIDWLHLWYLHGTTLDTYDHHQSAHGRCGRHWVSVERLRDGQAPYEPRGLLPIPGVSADEERTLRANLVFPNLPFATIGRVVRTYQVIPTGPETCLLEVRYFAAPGSSLDDDVIEQTMTIPRHEDGAACERLQTAVRSRGFRPGALAIEHERAIADFHGNLLALLEEGSGA